MTLQGSILSNGNPSTNCVPLSLEANKDSSNEYLNDTSNGSGDCVNEMNCDESVVGAQEPSDEPVIDITINNVVCSFSVKSHLNLKQIAQTGFNVEYRRENGVKMSLVLDWFGFISFVSAVSDGHNEVKETLHYSFNLVIRESYMYWRN